MLNLSKIWRTDIADGQPEVRVIQNIEQFSAELEFFPFADADVLERRKIPIHKDRALDDVTALISKNLKAPSRIGLKLLEGADVEPLLRRARSVIRVAGQLRTTLPRDGEPQSGEPLCSGSAVDRHSDCAGRIALPWRSGRCVKRWNCSAGAGFTFIEILSLCPTIWGKDPIEACKWVGENMIPNFPLNVFRDPRSLEIPNTSVPPQKTLAELVGDEPARNARPAPC